MGGAAFRRGLTLAFACVAAAPATAAALPAEGERATVDVELSTDRPGVAAGVTYRFEIKPPAGGGEPPALRRLVVAPPPGTVVDTSVPERCEASDEELRLRGDGVCPERSVLGLGSATLIVVGFGEQSFTQKAFNAGGAQFQTVKQGETVSGIVRGRFTDEGLDLLIPTCIAGGQPPDGCADDQARLLRSELVLPPYVAGERAYFTTPRECPATGRWRTKVRLTFDDATTEELLPEQPCQAPPQPCRSRRRIVFRALARVGLRSIAATLRGRRVRLDPRLPVLDLRGLPGGRYTVRVAAVTESGRRLRFVRRYRTCTA